MITLDFADKRPLYEQTKEKLRELIVRGVLRENEQLPSVRELAARLAVNPNTIAKAYRDLENEGYLYVRAAKGYYVAPRKESSDRTAKRASDLVDALSANVTELRYLGIEKEEIFQRIEELFREEVRLNDKG